MANDRKTTIIIDPDGSSQSGGHTTSTADFKPTRIRDQLNRAIDPEGQCCELNGRPYILFPNWDYAEDWSGEFVREVHPFALLGAREISAAEFWELVKGKRIGGTS